MFQGSVSAAALGGVPAHAALGGDDDVVASTGDGLADDFFGLAHAVDGGGVDGVDAGVEGGVDGGDGFSLVGAAPHPSADGPGAEDDGGDFEFRFAELAGCGRLGSVVISNLHYISMIINTVLAGRRCVNPGECRLQLRGQRRRFSGLSACPRILPIAESGDGRAGILVTGEHSGFRTSF